ncbi:MAG: putative alpha-E superfamily protein [Sulfurimonas sp.]|jgi:uncharacterized alpha-E superfamily protein
MEKYITGNVATSLYWLGRYLERTAITINEISIAYDEIIDIDKDAGVKLYDKYDIELKYENAYGFLKAAIYGEHNANILNMLTHARENAIISRHLLDSEAFGEIIELHTLFLSTFNNHLEIDYKLIDHASSLIGEIWNAQSKRSRRELSDSFFRIGKIIEEADYHIRFHEEKEQETINTILEEVDTICEQLTRKHDDKPNPLKLDADTQDERLTKLNSKISKIITG